MKTKGEQARDQAIDAVEASNAAWVDRATGVLKGVAEDYEFFTADEVWSHTMFDRPREPRAMGAVFRAARALGIARPTSKTRKSTRPVCHARPLRVWRSLV